MLRTRGICRDERQVDFGLHGRGQLDLGFFRSFLEALQGQLVLAQVNRVLFFELVGKVVDDPGVKILTTEESVTVRRFHFEHAVADFQHGHVEGTTTKVIDRNDTGILLVETIGQRGGCRLVDDTEHFKTGDLTGILGCLTLRVIEVGRNRDDRLGHRLAKIALGSLFHLLQDEGGNLRGGELVFVDLHPCVAVVTLDDIVGDQVHILLGQRIVETTADQTLDGKKGVFRIGDSLTLRRLADKTLT